MLLEFEPEPPLDYLIDATVSSLFGQFNTNGDRGSNDENVNVNNNGDNDEAISRKYLASVWAKIQKRREESGIAGTNVESFSLPDLIREKSVVKSSLKLFEAAWLETHKRPPSIDDKGLIRPLYEHNKRLRKQLSRYDVQSIASIKQMIKSSQQ